MAARCHAGVLVLAAWMSCADAATRVVELETDALCSHTTPSQHLSLRCAVTGANTGDVIQVTSSVVYTLTLADSSCATTFIAAAALQVCRRHLTIRSSTPNSLATIRVENDQDDGSGHRVLWVGAGASLTLVDIMLTGGRSLMRGGGVKLDAGATGVFIRAHFAANEAGSRRRALRRGWCPGDSRRLGAHRKLGDGKRRRHRGGRGRRGVVAPPEPQRARLEQARDFERSGRAAPLALAIWASLARLNVAFSLLTHRSQRGHRRRRHLDQRKPRAR